MALIPLIRDLSMLIVLMALFGLGHGFVFPAASTLVSRRADPEQHGVVTGLFYALLVSGVVVGAPSMAAVASVTNFGVGIWASAWIALLGLAFLGRAYLARGSEASVPSVPRSPADLMNAPRHEESGSSDPLMMRR
jgi:MFS family permease